MSIVAAKYLPNLGWVLAKNRDRNYKPVIRIRKSFRRDIERLYIWDDKTKYTEGVNEYGVAIVSSSISTKEDDLEALREIEKQNELTKKPRTFYSPTGLRIRTALFEPSARLAARALIDLEVSGNTIVADAEECFLIEAAILNETEYVYRIVEVPKNTIAVRTNHGIFIPWAGYSDSVPAQAEHRRSSEIRYQRVTSALKLSKSLEDVLDALSQRDAVATQLNPLRLDDTKGSIRTTGQIFLVPKERTMHYRAIWCETLFDLDKLNTIDEKTFFEVVSTRKLLTFNKFCKEQG